MSVTNPDPACFCLERHTPDRNILKEGVFRHLMVYVLKGISMYANRARRLGTKDEKVDRFIAHALSQLIAKNPLGLGSFKTLLDEALSMRESARRCYVNACAAAGKEPENLLGPATMDLFTDEGTLAAQARGLSARKLTGNIKYRQGVYWEGICIDRLATMGAVFVSAPTDTAATQQYDICDLIHTHLNALSEELSPLALMTLAEKIEKEQVDILNTLIAREACIPPVPLQRSRRFRTPMA